MVPGGIRPSARRFVYAHLENRPHDRLSACIQYFILTLIVLNTIAVVAGSVDSIAAEFHKLLYGVEIVSLSMFGMEYLLRLWSCVEDQRWAHPITGRLRYMITPLALIDLAAILPGILFPASAKLADLRSLRMIRLFRILRLLKIGRYSESMHMFAAVLKDKKEELAITGLVVMIMIVMSASLLYTVEHDAQPKAFSSIPQSMWWSVVTLTTVGYGDIYPITPLGKLLSSIISISGIALFAMPTAILASGFSQHIAHKRDAKTCPHCGKEI